MNRENETYELCRDGSLKGNKIGQEVFSTVTSASTPLPLINLEKFWYLFVSDKLFFQSL